MSWHALAQRRKIKVRVEDIVLVSGWTKTSGWSIAAYDKQDRSHDISLFINANAILSTKSAFSFEENHELGLRHREGPPLPQSPSGSPVSPKSRIKGKDSIHPTDQCLFLQYYKCRPRVFGLARIIKPQNLEPSDMMDNVADECLCTPFIGFINWWKQCFGEHRRGVEDEDQDDPSERVCLQLILPRLLFDDITVLGGSDYCFTRIYLIGISILTLLFADTNPNFNSLRKRK